MEALALAEPVATTRVGLQLEHSVVGHPSSGPAQMTSRQELEGAEVEAGAAGLSVPMMEGVVR